MTGITLFDSIENSQFPPGAAAYAAYVDGRLGDQPNYDWVVRAFPKAHHLSIALSADHDADALDVESGAASPSDIHGWRERQVRRGVARPVIYANAYTMQTSVLAVLSSAGIPRASVRLWTAHYSGQAHICGPRTCEALSIPADGTQWTSSAMGRVLDQSLLLDDFFGTPPAPAANSTEAIVQQLPTLKLGATGPAVRRVQGLLVAAGYDLGASGPRKDGIDGSFGGATDKAVRAFQAASRIGVDGEVGPAQTWPALLGV
jgi:hypothetical protein